MRDWCLHFNDMKRWNCELRTRKYAALLQVDVDKQIPDEKNIIIMSTIVVIWPTDTLYAWFLKIFEKKNCWIDDSTIVKSNP